jgi:DNA-binding NarL/FixJ family response regulator
MEYPEYNRRRMFVMVEQDENKNLVKAVSTTDVNILQIYKELDSLSKREQKTLILITDGLSNSEIAYKLSVSLHTTKADVQSIFKKLNVHDRVQAAKKAVLGGIL